MAAHTGEKFGERGSRNSNVAGAGFEPGDNTAIGVRPEEVL